MNKNLYAKLAMVIGIVVVAALVVYPLQDKLKPGIDLAGGTSLIYEIDTAGLEKSEIKGLALRMLPILRKRVDPTNVANILMRPLGDTRIEIQLPIASVKTVRKRKAYETALNELDSMNISMVNVKRVLAKGGQERTDLFAEIAGESESRKQILNDLTAAYDQRKVQQDVRDTISKKLDELAKQIDDAGESSANVRRFAFNWSKLPGEELAKEVNDYAKENEKVKKPLTEYIKAYGVWAQAVNELTDPKASLNEAYIETTAKLAKLNLSIAHITDVLELPEDSKKRKEDITTFKTDYPDRADKIEQVVTTFSGYRQVGGRLDDPEDLKRMLKGSGVLEFRILPVPGEAEVTAGEMEGYLEALRTQGPKQASDSRYAWFEIENFEKWHKIDPTTGKPSSVMGQFGEKNYVLASNQLSEIMNQQSSEKQWKLTKSRRTFDQMGLPVIGFNFDEIATKLFYNLTRNNVDRPLCILLDGLAISAPNITEAILGDGVIKGTFTDVEIDDMVNKLNAGSFPARLSDVPISEKTIGSTIGEENRNQGINAGLIGLAAVAVFMIAYYLLAGVIAVTALLLNLLFILAMMVILQATFTLPGIAGLILTIGMSVDANVLIFERIREEQDRGSSIRTAIANGYQRAFRTIFDANITTFFVALILWMVASEEIKGFAIVLMLGIISSLFTALFVTRVIFDLLVSQRLLKNKLVMLRLIHKPNINWMGLRTVFLCISAALVIGGLTIFATRDETENSKFDIEFTGGTSAQIDLKDGVDLNGTQVQERIRTEGERIGSPGLMAAKVYTVGKTGKQFEITTTETNKTEAKVTFKEGLNETVESVTAAIDAAMQDLGGTLYNLNVVKKDDSFEVSTSQVNKVLVRNVLNSAFGTIADVSEPEVIEIVTQAIKDAFAGQLKIRENLGLTITSEDKIAETETSLPDYLGGIKIECKLNNPVTYKQLMERFSAIRFKSDMRDLSWHQYSVLKSDLTEFSPEDTVSTFVYVSVHPDAGYREFSKDEWKHFSDNEKAKISNAASLATTLSRITQIDPSIGAQAKVRALIAIILSLIAIVAYIWIRFGTARYGFAAIAALVHDVCITLGAVTGCYLLLTNIPAVANALLLGDFKIDLAMIAAFLTIIGYSLNDTIVVFDRIRENRGKQIDVTRQIINNSLNQTLSRTILTSLTTFMVVLVMYIWGGAGLRGFTFAMLVGIVIGTYSSIAIAATILTLGNKLSKKG
jgi:SecD/SecF fusion protein